MCECRDTDRDAPTNGVFCGFILNADNIQHQHQSTVLPASVYPHQSLSSVHFISPVNSTYLFQLFNKKQHEIKASSRCQTEIWQMLKWTISLFIDISLTLLLYKSPTIDPWLQLWQVHSRVSTDNKNNSPGARFIPPHLSWSVSRSCPCSQAAILGWWGSRLYWEQDAWSTRICDRTSNSWRQREKWRWIRR